MSDKKWNGVAASLFVNLPMSPKLANVDRRTLSQSGVGRILSRHIGGAGALLSTAQELTRGGDSRILCGADGVNRYGCSPFPDPKVLAFGSSTASTISTDGFAAADALRKRLNIAAIHAPSHLIYEREMNRRRRELGRLCGSGNMRGTEIIFGASGTDLHLFASQLMIAGSAAPPMIVQVEAMETGSGVPDALAGCHFSNRAALADAVVSGAPLEEGQCSEIVEIACRNADGEVRPQAHIDRDCEAAVAHAVRTGRRVLLTLVDVSKTGLLAPSPDCADGLRRRFPGAVEVLVDACQFRLAPATVSAYLRHDFLVAISGSKFVAGPPFCGALLVPPAAANQLRNRRLPAALRSYSARADWPRGWAARTALNPAANFGLLLRWEAALTELRAFRRFPEPAVAEFLRRFADAVTNYMTPQLTLERDRSLTVAAFSGTTVDRGEVAPVKTWDSQPTVFPFLLIRKSPVGKSTWLSPDETKRVHRLLRDLRCEVGQPVSCGTRDGKPLSALRLCVSARTIVDALSPAGRGFQAVIHEAIAVLGNAALLASLPENRHSGMVSAA